MKHHPFKSVLIAVIAMMTTLTACAGPNRLSRSTVLEQNSPIAELEQRLMNAESAGVNYLSPDRFQIAKKSLEESIAKVQSQEKQEALQLVQKGQKSLVKAEANAELSRELLVEVLANRERANRAGAPNLHPEDLAKLEDELLGTTRLIEQGDLEEAKRRRPRLISGYEQVELMALKEGTVQNAKSAIERAKSERADKYAPKTYQLAEEQLKLAVSILEANRSEREKANAHAQRAIDLADKSVQVAELVKDFGRRDFTPEDTVLWYQQQITTMSDPLGTPPEFTQPNRSIVFGLRETIDSLVKNNEDLRSQVLQREAKVEELGLAQIKERETMQGRERETAQRFEYVNSLFAAEEANVYRQRQNVLLSVHGFYFAPGMTEIEALNFPLLNKINEGIKQFPNSRLQILGHTDSTGSLNTNLVLSEGRATNVAKFLIETGGVDSSRVSVKGLGEEKPVASNETKEGRTLNRRVEVLIIN